MQDAQHIATLIRKHLRQELTETEQDELRTWLAGDAERQAYLDTLTEGDGLLDDLALYHRLWGEGLYASRLERIMGRIHAKKVAPPFGEKVVLPKPRKLRIGNNRWRARVARALIAATLLSALSIGYYYWRNSQLDTEHLTSIYGDDVLPGSNRAVLTLADGRTIDLDSAQSGIVIGADDIKYQNGEPIQNVILSEGTGEAPRGIEGSLPNLLSLSTPKGGQYQITLPDGTKVWLNAASTLKYPSRFSDDERVVELTGEAYFDVAEIQGTRVPFKVQTPGQTVEVLGTEFNISAYDDEQVVRTTLVEGKVKVTPGTIGDKAKRSPEHREGLTTHDSRLTTKILQPGQQATTRGAATTVNEVDVESYTAWKEGLIVLNSATPEEVFKHLERWYDVEFRVAHSQMNKERAYISINRNEKLSAVLIALELTYGMHLTIKGKEVTEK